MENIIIGAGLTGLSCAYHLGNNYIILEKESNPGGLCRSIRKDGFIFDWTGHFLHLHTDYGKNFVKMFLKDNLLKIERNSWIYSNSTFTRYPFQVNLYGLPGYIIKDCISGYINAYYKKKKNKDYISFMEWTQNTFGRGFSKYFFIPYNEKLWKVKSTVLNSDWVSKFVPQPSPVEVFWGASVEYKKQFGYNSYFYYPKKGGIGTLIESIAEKLKNIKTDTEIIKINSNKREVFFKNEKLTYKHLISTIPLPRLLEIISDLPKDIKEKSKKLKYTSVYCFNLGLNRKSVMNGMHWIYFPEKDKIFYRVGCYSNILKGMAPRYYSSIYVECSVRSGDKVNPELLFDKILHDLKKCKILRSEKDIVIKNILYIPFGYVIYDIFHSETVKTIKNYLIEHSIYTAGRYGAWKYSYMEESILEGKEIAECIRNGKNKSSSYYHKT